MNIHKAIKSTLLIALVVVTHLSFAQSSLKVDKVTIFTDGNSYFQKSGLIETENKKYELSGADLPIARYGTLEITDDANTLMNITSSLRSKTTTPKPHNVSNAQGLLSLNKGINLEVKTTNGTFSGTLEQVYPNYIVVKTDKTLMIKTADIQSFSFDTEPVYQVTPKKTKIETPVQPGLRGNDYTENTTMKLEFSSEGSKKLNLKYLQKGLTWSPVYTLRFLNKKKANLILQAELVNDAEDLVNTDINLVLGTPNFNHSTHMSDLLDFINILNPTAESIPYENSISIRGARSSGLSYVAPPVTNQYNDNTEPHHDFYIHKLNDINLKKHSRGLYKILNIEIPYKHIYECNLIKLEQNYNKFNKPPKNIIYHSLMIENNSNILIGEGSMMVIDGMNKTDLPIAQTTLDYIAPKTEGSIRLTETYEIELVHKENTIKKSSNKINSSGHTYYEATVEGVIKIKNLKNENVELYIKNIIDGEVIMTGDGGEILFQRQPTYSPNYESKIQWIVTLDPGESKEIVYQYKVLVL